MKADKSHGKHTTGNSRKDTNVSQTLLIPDATFEQRELLSMALSDAVFYHNPAPPHAVSARNPTGCAKNAAPG